MVYDQLLDVCQLRCPITIIRTKASMSKLTKGQTLLVVATDPSYHVDCSVFIRQTGHLLLQSWQTGEKFFYLLQHNST